MSSAAVKDPLSGHPGHLDETQQTALAKFREELLADGLIPANAAELTTKIGYDRFDDQTLLRFLRARKFDLPKAKLMWENNEKWRKEFGADEIAANGFDYPEQAEVDKYYPQFYHKTDRDGRPIYIEQLGKLDIAKLYALTTQERQLKHLVGEYEKFFRDRLPACSKMKGELVETSCTILDLHNAGISSFYRVKDYVSAASAIGQNNYVSYMPSRGSVLPGGDILPPRNSPDLPVSHPTSSPSSLDIPAENALTPQPETMGHMFIVNAPYLFSTVWSLVKPWLDEATVRKIHILGKGFKTELNNYIEPANLPSDLGGSCKCPGSCSLSDAGPWNPQTK